MGIIILSKESFKPYFTKHFAKIWHNVVLMGHAIWLEIPCEGFLV